MACTVYRNPKTQEIDKVTTESGKTSKLFNSIVELGLDKEAALRKWAVTYTPTFKNWFQAGDVDSNGEPRIVNVNGDPVFIAEDKTIKHATENLGSFNNPRSSELIDEINQNKIMFQLNHALKSLWVNMDEIIARAVYHTVDFVDANDVIEMVDGGECIEDALFSVVGVDWFRDHCSSSDYLDNEICNELMTNE